MFTQQQLNQSIDEHYLDAFLDIQCNVESDSHLAFLDYSYMEMEEIIEVVQDNIDLLGY